MHITLISCNYIQKHFLSNLIPEVSAIFGLSGNSMSHRFFKNIYFRMRFPHYLQKQAIGKFYQCFICLYRTWSHYPDIWRARFVTWIPKLTVILISLWGGRLLGCSHSLLGSINRANKYPLSWQTRLTKFCPTTVVLDTNKFFRHFKITPTFTKLYLQNYFKVVFLWVH